MTEHITLIRNIAAIIGLGYFSYEDIRFRRVGTLPITIYAVVGLSLFIAAGDWRDLHWAVNFIPGLCCLILGLVSKESIGYGDGLILLALGVYMALTELLQICFIAITLSGVTAIIFLTLLHKGRKTEIPFIPFLLAAKGICVFSNM